MNKNISVLNLVAINYNLLSDMLFFPLAHFSYKKHKDKTKSLMLH